MVPDKRLHQLKMRNRLKMMKKKIKKMSHLKEKAMIKGEMNKNKTRKMTKKDKVKDRHSCWCFGSDRAPGVAPQGAFWSRTVLSTVARWFVQNAQEIVDNCV
jgi:hypothetical protein